MTNTALELIAGLGNPGTPYAKNRHNVGVWFIESLCDRYRINLRNEPKFNARMGVGNIEGQEVRIILPNTYMNHSGQPISSVLNYFQLPITSLLVAYDELDLPVGTARLKIEGGHGGHNGMRDIIHHLKVRDFYRLRLGIGHPGDKAKVTEYVLNNPSMSDEKLIRQAIERALDVMPQMISGNIQTAMNKLHTLDSKDSKVSK